VAPVQADTHDDEAGEVESERPEEGHDSAHSVACLPGHSGVPPDL
jgi:hypothetical protein